MRDIKFRAWNKKMKHMVYPDALEGTSISDMGWRIGIFVDNHCGELMQYTGLKDNSGQEIYEGDILKDLYGHHLKVVFDGGSFRAVFGDSICEVEGSELAGYYPKDITEFFIVGNIYENTEMLK